jgi:hypothetical protein
MAGEGNDKENQKDYKQQFRDAGCCNGYAGKAENCRNQGYQQER